MSWEDLLLRKARAIHAEIAALQNYVAEGEPSADAESRLDALAASHYAMLDDLYLRQIPFARTAAGADLFLNYRGPAALRGRAEIGAVDRLFGNIRAQVGAITDAVAGARAEAAPEAQDRQEKPREGEELVVVAYSPGLYVGFGLPDAASPRGTAMREGVRNLGAAAACLPESDPQEGIAGAIDDPQVRDATLGALRKLLPVRDKEIEAVEIRGRVMALERPALLDRQGWQTAQRLMSRPIGATERASFTGHILQVDYELRRFDLRWVDDPRVAHLRCAYGEMLAADCERLVKRKVEVVGAVSLRKGRPRLLHVEGIREV